MQLNYTNLRERIAVASRRAFDALKVAHPNERFYTFALYANDDAVGVCPSSNSEEAYERVVAKWTADTSHQRWLAEKGISFETALLGDGRWSAYEWEYECYAADDFDAVDELINNRGTGFYDHDDPLGFARFKAGVFASMVFALSDLEYEGYFGVGHARESVTVFCSVPNSRCTAWLEEDSARRLNPDAAYQTFLNERIDWIADESDDDGSDPESICGLYLSHLRPRKHASP